jgi:hypothetical protein
VFTATERSMWLKSEGQVAVEEYIAGVRDLDDTWLTTGVHTDTVEADPNSDELDGKPKDDDVSFGSPLNDLDVDFLFSNLSPRSIKQNHAHPESASDPEDMKDTKQHPGKVVETNNAEDPDDDILVATDDSKQAEASTPNVGKKKKRSKGGKKNKKKK